MTNQMDQEVEEAREALAREFGRSVAVSIQGEPERASEIRIAAMDALIEAVRQQERERVITEAEHHADRRVGSIRQVGVRLWREVLHPSRPPASPRRRSSGARPFQ